VFLTQNLSSDDLVDYLAQERMIDGSVRQKLGMYCFTPMEKNRWIVDSLATGPPDTLKKFCAILRKVKKNFIADELEKGILCSLFEVNAKHFEQYKMSNSFKIQWNLRRSGTYHCPEMSINSNRLLQ